jgi:hypothetical protein
MGLEDALNNLTDELRRRRGVSTDYSSGDSGGDSSDAGSYGSIEHHDDDEHDHHDDCIDADGDGHCDNDDD